MQFDRGYLSPYMVTIPPHEAVLEDCLILSTRRSSALMKEMLPLLEQVAQSGKPLSSSPRTWRASPATLVVNKLRGLRQAVP